MERSPILITVLPSKNEQMIMLSYLFDDYLNVRDLMDKLKCNCDSIDTGELSKKLIEELKIILISPKIWQSFDARKQWLIENYWYDSIGNSEQDFNINPALVDMFSTSI